MTAIYFTGDIDPDSNDTRLQLVERPADDGATIISYQWAIPDSWLPVHGANADPTLAVFYDPQEIDHD